MSDERERYYEEARQWATQAHRTARRHNAILGLTLIALIAIVVIQAVAIVKMLPLKTIEPIPILVDRQSGFVQVLDKSGRQTLEANDALTRSLLAQYISSREGYDAATVRYDYHKVALFSAGEARNSYLALMQSSNPKSPLVTYGPSEVLETHIDSVSLIGPKTAMVRFQTRLHVQGQFMRDWDSWVAILGFRYTDQPMKVADRLTNPLGFQVTRYRKDPEVRSETTKPDSSKSQGTSRPQESPSN